MNNDIIIAQEVTKQFVLPAETLHILNGVNLHVSQAESCAISGASGSGKTTFLSIIAGLDKASSGNVLVDNFSLTDGSDENLSHFRRKKIGFIFQLHFLLYDFTVLENVMLPAMLDSRSVGQLRMRAQKLLSAVGMQHRLAHKPAQLSGGERQRVAVARALINHPSVLIADEPTGNLDEKNSQIVEELLFGIAHDMRVTLLLATHDTQLMQKADRYFHLEGGVLV
ncbi:hypothetical protein LSH36_793g01259 [Paralvinella palmiformis]|uniref:ABC transporter domain-containing protein n=1 Tax=Paralvinella palmiformis TaxID=53620 RepID=A0AAD9MV16_9ANNE|nr:hypothetical protein LSH36_793g01259 [Paralvinella palmiformis]